MQDMMSIYLNLKYWCFGGLHPWLLFWVVCVPPESICLSPNPQYFRMWPYMGIHSLQIYLKRRLSGWTLIHYDSCPYWIGTFGHWDAHRENAMWKRRRTLGWCSHKLGTPKIARKAPGARGEVWNIFFFTALRRNQPCLHIDLLFLDSRTVRK